MGVLRGVIDPELGTDIVELGMARSVAIEDDGQVNVTIALTTSGCPLRAQIQREVRARVSGLPGFCGAGPTRLHRRGHGRRYLGLLYSSDAWDRRSAWWIAGGRKDRANRDANWRRPPEGRLDGFPRR